jgi:tetratricopeptide (TPR) repeat protein
MSDTERSPAVFARDRLPWLVCGAGLLLYLVTLHPWLSLESLPSAGRVLGWTWWWPDFQAPVHFLVTYPVRWLPQGWQVGALNLLSALCAAGTLGLLARSVALLPQDRTAFQRTRNRSGDGLLHLSTNWVPPLLAAALLAVQFRFWQHAIQASQESLNLLLFAAVIWCALEHRVRKRDGWLHAAGFGYGLALTNNWAMLALLPVAAVAVLWLKGWGFFRWRFVLTLLASGLAGLSLYLLMPALELASGRADTSYWTWLRFELGAQKNMLGPVRGWLAYALPALAPLAFLSVRWATHSGEVGMGARLTAPLFQLLHVFFGTLAVLPLLFPPAEWLKFPEFHLVLRYLMALSTGYFAGYGLLCAIKPSESWRKETALGVLARKLALAAVWVLLLAAPLVIGWHSAGRVQEVRRSPLADFSAHLSAHLPEKPAVLLSDDPTHLLAVQAQFHRERRPLPHALLDTRSLTLPRYHGVVARRYPELWKDRFSSVASTNSIAPISLLQVLADTARETELIYLHPSFGYYFEVFHAAPKGMAYTLRTYEVNTVEPPPLTAESVAATETFWQMAGTPSPYEKRPETALPSDREQLGKLYTRAANAWGVRQQRAGNLPEARRHFETALAYWPSNRAAAINLEVNQALQTGRPASAESIVLDDDHRDVFGHNRGWTDSLTEFGPYDEPRLCFAMGGSFVQSQLLRQAAIEFIRARTLDPTNAVYRLAEAETYLQGRRPQQALQVVNELRKEGVLAGLSSEAQVGVFRLEAAAHASLTNYPAAIKLLENATSRLGAQPALLELLVQVHTAAGQPSEALRIIDEHLARNSGDVPALIQKAALQLRLNETPAALATLDQALVKSPRHPAVLELRASASMRLEQWDKARVDLEALRSVAPVSPVPHIGLGEVAEKQNRASEAIAHYEKALSLASPNSRESAIIRSRLEKLRSGKP